MAPNYNPDDRLIETDEKLLGQRIPKLLHERVEALCSIAYEAGERKRPSKEDMVAALILDGPTDGQELRDLLEKYANATVAEALPQTANAQQLPKGTLIELPQRNSGPRSPGQPGPVIRPPEKSA
jgi:hypothetical protein